MDSLDESLSCNSEGNEFFIKSDMRGKGPNGLNCWKITAATNTSKDFDIPLAFLLRCTELSLD